MNLVVWKLSIFQILSMFTFSLVDLNLLKLAQAKRAPTEAERVEEWYSSGQVWPPNWQPETEGMKKLMEQREKEIMSIPGGDERFENWLQFTQSRLVPKFTPYGFKLVNTPPAVHKKLADAVAEGLSRWETLRSEGSIDVIYHPNGLEPKFVDLGKCQYNNHDIFIRDH